MKSFKYILPVAVFALILFGLGARGMIAEEKTYSTIEKRELQTMPKIRVKAIKKGTFQEKYETYLSDQFPCRDTWVQVQTDASRLMGKTISNGVYFGKDDYLLEQYTDSDYETKRVKKNVKALANLVNEIVDDYNVHVMLVPTKT